MATANLILEGAKMLGIGVKDLIQLGASLTQQGINVGTKVYVKKAEENKALVEIPEIYSSDFRLKLKDAMDWLKEDGLNAAPVIVQPNIKFKDCSDLEIVGTNYKLGKKVKPGTRIILKYVTTDVIEDSRKLFDESERQKAEAKQKKAEQSAKNKQKLEQTVANAQQGLNDAVTNTKENIEGVLSNFTKKKV